MSHEADTMKQCVDFASVAIVVATIAEWLPGVAALLTVVWTAIRIWETATVQRLVGKKRES